ncbi:hypothetical protein [Methylobacterium platani]|uniref:hypothetical protein n=1 Tax=Methylobacterium platani TaxID=427683 RepID=UPI000A651AE9|nr:hypothetical protein [Methylobacterium platani]
MPNVITFPGRVRAIDKTFQNAALRAGLAEAEHRGITRARLQAVLTTEQDRQFVNYYLGMLGSDKEAEREWGALALSRLLHAIGGEA